MKKVINYGLQQHQGDHRRHSRIGDIFGSGQAILIFFFNQCKIKKADQWLSHILKFPLVFGGRI